jgi:NAD dependent epimerase/dehydratase family
VHTALSKGETVTDQQIKALAATSYPRTCRRASQIGSPSSPVLVLGGDGYLGWPTALHFSAAGHDVTIIDSYIRRGYDRELHTDSLIPISPLPQRIARWRAVTGRCIDLLVGDLTDPVFVTSALRRVRPETIIHLAEQRSAPYSMIDQQHAVHTQVNNVVDGDCRDCSPGGRRPLPACSERGASPRPTPMTSSSSPP